MRVGILAVIVAGCGSVETPSAPPGEPIEEAHEEVSSLETPSASASTTASEARPRGTKPYFAPCQPCPATDPLCNCFEGMREVWPLPGGGPSSASAKAGAAPPASLVVVPVRIIAKRERMVLIIEVDAGGVLALGMGGTRKSRVIGTLDGTGLVTTDGNRIAQLATDGTLTIPGDEVVRLDAQDEALMDDGTRVSIAKDGVIHAIRADGKRLPGFTASVERFKPEMRRTAIVAFMTIYRVR